jgi:hypothetical protein
LKQVAKKMILYYNPKNYIKIICRCGMFFIM